MELARGVTFMGFEEEEDETKVVMKVRLDPAQWQLD